MRHAFQFTFEFIRGEYRKIMNSGYRVVTCAEYADLKGNAPAKDKILINRVDIDFSCKKAKKLAQIFNEIGIRASFFVRLHACEYNPFSFENYLCLKFIRDSGHEIGYHSEIVDQGAIWDESSQECLKRDIEILNRILDIRIKGVASHGGMTGLNNLDFWKEKQPEEFNLEYEAYDWFDNTYYVSDSEWTMWKCYRMGKLVKDDRRTPGEHASDGPSPLYLLIHSDTYYDRHIYE